MERLETGTSPLTPTTPEETQLRQALESAGWRLTRQRAAVYRCLAGAHHHPTAEEVYAAVRPDLPNISLATVYKSLEALVACKLAVKLSFGDGPARYDCRTENHYHLRCLRTGKVRDLPIPHDPALLQKLHAALGDVLRAEGFQLTDYRLELLGYFDGQGHPPPIPGERGASAP